MPCMYLICFETNTHYFKRAQRAVLLLLCALLLSACNFAGALYQTAPKLALFELNSTLDLSSAQYDQGALRLDSIYQWHRKTELPALVAQLQVTSRAAQSGASPAQVAATMDWGIAAARRMAAHTLPQQVELVQSLTNDNLQALQKKYAKDNAKFRKEWGVGEPAAEALKTAQDKRFDTFLTWAERIYGDLSSEQTRQLRATSDARVLRLDWVVDERVQRQQALLAILRAAVDKKLNAAQIQAALSDYTAKLDRASTPERQAFLDLSRTQTAALIAQLTNLATPEQRSYAQKKLQGFAEDFQAISAKP
jgi:Family of unknown function (DUF6279)